MSIEEIASYFSKMILKIIGIANLKEKSPNVASSYTRSNNCRLIYIALPYTYFHTQLIFTLPLYRTSIRLYNETMVPYATKVLCLPRCWKRLSIDSRFYTYTYQNLFNPKKMRPISKKTYVTSFEDHPSDIRGSHTFFTQEEKNGE